jgi:hypothetical protein
MSNFESRWSQGSTSSSSTSSTTSTTITTTKMTQSQYTSYWVSRHRLDIVGDVAIAMGLFLGIAINPAAIAVFVGVGIAAKIASALINRDTTEFVSALSEAAYETMITIAAAGALYLSAIIISAVLFNFGLAGLTGGIWGAAHIIGAFAGTTFAAATTIFLYQNDYQHYKNS